MKKENFKKSFTRAISVLTLGFFLVNQIAYAAPGLGIEVAPAGETPGFLRIDIPAELATLDAIYEAPPSADPKVILHIQNAHANYGAQKKIQQLLEHLNKAYAIRTIFVEGAAEDLDPGQLKLFPDQERNAQLADLLAQQGELTGAELFILEKDEELGLAPRSSSLVKEQNQNESRVPSPAPRAAEDRQVEALGIEDAALYRRNYEALKEVFGAETLVNRYLDGYESRLDALASKVFDPALRRVLAGWKKFEKGHREFMPFVKGLSEEAKRVLKTDLESLFAQVEWPQITRLLVLQQMEKELNTARALEEKERLLDFLRSMGASPVLLAEVENFKEQRLSVRQGQGDLMQPAKTGTSSSRDVLEALVREAAPRGFRFSDYPAFSLYAGYLILKSELDAKGLFEEIKTLFDRILDRLAETPRQKALLQLYRDEALARKLMSLELSRREWGRTVARRPEVGMDSLVGRLKDLSAEVTREMKLAPSDLETKQLSSQFRERVLELYGAAFRFYEFARKREEVFFEKIDSVMKERSVTKAVLITGGFHTDGMTDLFREHQISYGVLTPRLMEKSDDNLYRNSMLQEYPSLFDRSNLEIASVLQSRKTLEAQGKDVGKEIKNILENFYMKVLVREPGQLKETLEFLVEALKSKGVRAALSGPAEGPFEVVFQADPKETEKGGKKYIIKISMNPENVVSVTFKAAAASLVEAAAPQTPARTTGGEPAARSDARSKRRARPKGSSVTKVIEPDRADKARSIFTKGSVARPGQEIPAFSREDFSPPGVPGADMSLPVQDRRPGRNGELVVIRNMAGWEQARNEALAHFLYAEAGVRVPRTELVEIDGQPALIQEYIPPGEPLSSEEAVAEMTRHLEVDAWLANRDVAETDILRAPDGEIFRIHRGGALEYGARGEPKGAAWGPQVPEIGSMRSRGAAEAGAVQNRVRSLVETMTPEKIDEALEKCGYPEEQRTQLKDVLLARLSFMAGWAEGTIEIPTDIPGGDTTQTGTEAGTPASFEGPIGEVMTLEKLRHSPGSLEAVTAALDAMIELLRSPLPHLQSHGTANASLVDLLKKAGVLKEGLVPAEIFEKYFSSNLFSGANADLFLEVIGILFQDPDFARALYDSSGALDPAALDKVRKALDRFEQAFSNHEADLRSAMKEFIDERPPIDLNPRFGNPEEEIREILRQRREASPGSRQARLAEQAFEEILLRIRTGYFFPEVLVLIRRFINTPGMSNLLVRIAADGRSEAEISGFVAELFHALLREAQGFRVAALGLGTIDRERKPLCDIDILLEKDGKYYAVTAKHKKPKQISNARDREQRLKIIRDQLAGLLDLSGEQPYHTKLDQLIGLIQDSATREDREALWPDVDGFAEEGERFSEWIRTGNQPVLLFSFPHPIGGVTSPQRNVAFRDFVRSLREALSLDPIETPGSAPSDSSSEWAEVLLSQLGIMEGMRSLMEQRGTSHLAPFSVDHISLVPWIHFHKRKKEKEPEKASRRKEAADALHEILLEIQSGRARVDPAADASGVKRSESQGEGEEGGPAVRRSEDRAEKAPAKKAAGHVTGLNLLPIVATFVYALVVKAIQGISENALPFLMAAMTPGQFLLLNAACLWLTYKGVVWVANHPQRALEIIRRMFMSVWSGAAALAGLLARGAGAVLRTLQKGWVRSFGSGRSDTKPAPGATPGEAQRAEKRKEAEAKATTKGTPMRAFVEYSHDLALQLAAKILQRGSIGLEAYDEMMKLAKKEEEDLLLQKKDPAFIRYLNQARKLARYFAWISGMTREAAGRWVESIDIRLRKSSAPSTARETEGMSRIDLRIRALDKTARQVAAANLSHEMGHAAHFWRGRNMSNTAPGILEAYAELFEIITLFRTGRFEPAKFARDARLGELFLDFMDANRSRWDVRRLPDANTDDWKTMVTEFGSTLSASGRFSVEEIQAILQDADYGFEHYVGFAVLARILGALTGGSRTPDLKTLELAARLFHESIQLPESEIDFQDPSRFAADVGRRFSDRVASLAGMNFWRLLGKALSRFVRSLFSRAFTSPFLVPGGYSRIPFVSDIMAMVLEMLHAYRIVPMLDATPEAPGAAADVFSPEQRLNVLDQSNASRDALGLPARAFKASRIERPWLWRIRSGLIVCVLGDPSLPLLDRSASPEVPPAPGATPPGEAQRAEKREAPSARSEKRGPKRELRVNSRIPLSSDMAAAHDLNERFMASSRGVISENSGEFSAAYREVNEIFRNILVSAGLDPDIHQLVLVDSNELIAEVLFYDHRVYLSLGLIRHVVRYAAERQAEQQRQGILGAPNQSRAMLAFVIAHEVRHLAQFREDYRDGAEPENTQQNFSKVQVFSDEKDADQIALDYMEAAGYSVQGALDLMLFLKSYMDTYKLRESLFGDHQALAHRTRSVQKAFSRYWAHFHSSGDLSDTAKEELAKPSQRNAFSIQVREGFPATVDGRLVSGYETREYFNKMVSLMTKAENIEQLIMAYRIGKAAAQTEGEQREVEEIFQRTKAVFWANMSPEDQRSFEIRMKFFFPPFREGHYHYSWQDGTSPVEDVLEEGSRASGNDPRVRIRILIDMLKAGLPSPPLIERMSNPLNPSENPTRMKGRKAARNDDSLLHRQAEHAIEAYESYLDEVIRQIEKLEPELTVQDIVEIDRLVSREYQKRRIYRDLYSLSRPLPNSPHPYFLKLLAQRIETASQLDTAGLREYILSLEDIRLAHMTRLGEPYSQIWVHFPVLLERGILNREDVVEILERKRQVQRPPGMLAIDPQMIDDVQADVLSETNYERWFRALNIQDPQEMLRFHLEHFQCPNMELIQRIRSYFGLGDAAEVELIGIVLTDFLDAFRDRQRREDVSLPTDFHRNLLEMNERLYRLTLAPGCLGPDALEPIMARALARPGIRDLEGLSYEIRKVIFFFEMGGVFHVNQAMNPYRGRDVTPDFISYLVNAGMLNGTPIISTLISSPYPDQRASNAARFTDHERKALYAYLVSLGETQERRALFNIEHATSAGIKTWNDFLTGPALLLNIGQCRDGGFFVRTYLGEGGTRVDRLFFSAKPTDRETSDDLAGSDNWLNRCFIEWNFYRPRGIIKPSEILTRLREYGLPILAEGAPFSEQVDAIDAAIPPGVMKNIALYLLFVERVLRNRCGLAIEDTLDAYFDEEGMRARIDSLDPGAKADLFNGAAMIAARLVEDVAVRGLNEGAITERKMLRIPGNVYWERLSNQPRKMSNHRRRLAPGHYPSAEFTELGGSGTQIDLLVPAITGNILVGRLRAGIENPAAAANELRARIELIRRLFRRNSRVKDYYVEKFADFIAEITASDRVDPAQRQAVLDILKEMMNTDVQSSSVRDRVALKALELDRRINAADFSDLSEEVRIITEVYFRDYSFTRDDILSFLISERVHHPDQLVQVQSLMLCYKGNARKEGVREKVHNEYRIRQIVEKLGPDQKKDLLLWLMGARSEKPRFLENFEREFEMNFDFLRGDFQGKDGAYYKGIGRSIRQDFIEMLLYGENGIFAPKAVGLISRQGYHNEAAKKLFDEIFDLVYPNYPDANTEGRERRALYKKIYDLLFEKAEEGRRENVLMVLAAQLPRIAGMPAQTEEEMRLREAAVIGVFFKSFGLGAVKLGQILSTSKLVDLTDEIREELGKLRDDAFSMDKGAVFEMTDRVYGSFGAAFASLGQNFHNASIKVTYEVTGVDGVRRIMKVKRPDALQRIEQEMTFLRNVTQGLQDKLGIKVPSQMISSLESRIRRELDFENEARSQEALASAAEVTLRGWHDPDLRGYEIYVPRVNEVRENALMTEEFAEGVPATDGEGMARLGIDPQAVEAILGKLFFRMIYVAGFYHADPHLGNVFVSRTPEGRIRISLIDLGAAGTVSRENRKSLWQMMLGIGLSRMRFLSKNRWVTEGLRGVVQNAADITKEVEEEIDGILRSDGSAVNKFLAILTALEKREILLKDEVMDLFLFVSAFSHMFAFGGSSRIKLLQMLFSIRVTRWVESPGVLAPARAETRSERRDAEEGETLLPDIAGRLLDPLDLRTILPGALLVLKAMLTMASAGFSGAGPLSLFPFLDLFRGESPGKPPVASQRYTPADIAELRGQLSGELTLRPIERPELRAETRTPQEFARRRELGAGLNLGAVNRRGFFKKLNSREVQEAKRLLMTDIMNGAKQFWKNNAGKKFIAEGEESELMMTLGTAGYFRSPEFFDAVIQPYFQKEISPRKDGITVLENVPWKDHEEWLNALPPEGGDNEHERGRRLLINIANALTDEIENLRVEGLGGKFHERFLVWFSNHFSGSISNYILWKVFAPVTGGLVALIVGAVSGLNRGFAKVIVAAVVSIVIGKVGVGFLKVLLNKKEKDWRHNYYMGLLINEIFGLDAAKIAENQRRYEMFFRQIETKYASRDERDKALLEKTKDIVREGLNLVGRYVSAAREAALLARDENVRVDPDDLVVNMLAEVLAHDRSNYKKMKRNLEAEKKKRERLRRLTGSVPVLGEIFAKETLEERLLGLIEPAEAVVRDPAFLKRITGKVRYQIIKASRKEKPAVEGAGDRTLSNEEKIKRMANRIYDRTFAKHQLIKKIKKLESEAHRRMAVRSYYGYLKARLVHVRGESPAANEASGEYDYRGSVGIKTRAWLDVLKSEVTKDPAKFGLEADEVQRMISGLEKPLEKMERAASASTAAAKQQKIRAKSSAKKTEPGKPSSLRRSEKRAETALAPARSEARYEAVDVAARLGQVSPEVVEGFIQEAKFGVVIATEDAATVEKLRQRLEVLEYQLKVKIGALDQVDYDTGLGAVIDDAGKSGNPVIMVVQDALGGLEAYLPKPSSFAPFYKEETAQSAVEKDPSLGTLYGSGAGALLKGLEELRGFVPVSPVPRNAVKMSALGYPVGDEITLESSGGLQQVKPAGKDAYIIFSRDEGGKWSHHMVQIDADGEPVGYRSAVSRSEGRAETGTEAGEKPFVGESPFSAHWEKVGGKYVITVTGPSEREFVIEVWNGEKYVPVASRFTTPEPGSSSGTAVETVSAENFREKPEGSPVNIRVVAPARAETRFSQFAAEGIARLADRVLLDMAFRLRNVGPADGRTAFDRLGEAIEETERGNLDQTIGAAVKAAARIPADEIADPVVDVLSFDHVKRAEAVKAFRDHREECVRIIGNYIRSFGSSLTEWVLLTQLVNRQKYGMVRDFSDMKLPDWELEMRKKASAGVNHWRDSVLRMSSRLVDFYRPEMDPVRNRLKGRWQEDFMTRDDLPESENSARQILARIMMNRLRECEARAREANSRLLNTVSDITREMEGKWGGARLPVDAYGLDVATMDLRSIQRDIGRVMQGLTQHDAVSVAAVLRDLVQSGSQGERVGQQAGKIFGILKHAGIGADPAEVVFVETGSNLARVLFSRTNENGTHIDLGGGKSLILVRTGFGTFEDVETLVHELLHKDFRSARPDAKAPKLRRILEEALVARKAIDKTQAIRETILQVDPRSGGWEARWRENSESSVYVLERRFMEALTSGLSPEIAASRIDRYLREGDASALPVEAGRLEKIAGFIDQYASQIYDADPSYVVGLTFLTKALEDPSRFETTMASAAEVCRLLKEDAANREPKFGSADAFLAARGIVDRMTAEPDALAADVTVEAFSEAASKRAPTARAETREGEPAGAVARNEARAADLEKELPGEVRRVLESTRFRELHDAEDAGTLMEVFWGLVVTSSMTAGEAAEVLTLVSEAVSVRRRSAGAATSYPVNWENLDALVKALETTAPRAAKILAKPASDAVKGGNVPIVLDTVPTRAEWIFLRILLGRYPEQKFAVAVCSDSLTEAQKTEAKNEVKEIALALDHLGNPIGTGRLGIQFGRKARAKDTVQTASNRLFGASSKRVVLSVDVPLDAALVSGTLLESRGTEERPVDRRLNGFRFGAAALASREGMENARELLKNEAGEDVIKQKENAPGSFVFDEAALSFIAQVWEEILTKITTEVAA